MASYATDSNPVESQPYRITFKTRDLISNATMYREAGARRGVHLTRNVRIHSILPTARAWTREWAQEGYKYTQVYAWELVVSWIWQWGDWSSHSRQMLCWIQLKHGSKNLSSKYILYKYEIIHAWCIRFELLSDADRHITRHIHKVKPKGETWFTFTIGKDQHSLICGEKA